MKKLFLSLFLLLSWTVRAEKFPEVCINYFALVQTLGKDDPYLKDFLQVSRELREWWKTADKKDQARFKAHCKARKARLEQALLQQVRKK